jgi:hypothetical protein
MNDFLRPVVFMAVILGIFWMGAVGCNNTENKTDSKSPSGGSSVAESTSAHNYKGRDWCAEHGIPESDCALCNADIAANYKKKGDWCAEHDRPESQCFFCHPENKAKFADAYRLKFGEDPPPIGEEDPDHEHAEGDHKHDSGEKP